MSYFKCPICGKFVGKVRAFEDDFRGRIVKVVGVCKKHGEVDVTYSSSFELK